MLGAGLGGRSRTRVHSRLLHVWRGYNVKLDATGGFMALKPTVKEVPWEVFEVFLKKIFKRSK